VGAVVSVVDRILVLFLMYKFYLAGVFYYHTNPYRGYAVNTNRLLSNNACSISNNAGCTVKFGSGGNTSSLIC
jgi:hypothetical protein